MAPVCQRQCGSCPFRPKEGGCCGLVECVDSLLSVVDQSTRAAYYAFSMMALMPQWQKPLQGITLVTHLVREATEYALSLPDIAQGKGCDSPKPLKRWAARSKLTASLLTQIYFFSEWGLLPFSSQAVWIGLAAKSFSSTGHALNLASKVHDALGDNSKQDTPHKIVDFAGEFSFLVAETFFVERIPLLFTAVLAISSGVWGLNRSYQQAAA